MEKTPEEIRNIIQKNLTANLNNFIEQITVNEDGAYTTAFTDTDYDWISDFLESMY